MTDIRVLRREAPKPVQPIVDKLRELLARAETGELRELLVYYTDNDTIEWESVITDYPTCVGTIVMRVIPGLADEYNEDGGED
jgi:hypothetical protein